MTPDIMLSKQEKRLRRAVTVLAGCNAKDREWVLGQLDQHQRDAVATLLQLLEGRPTESHLPEPATFEEDRPQIDHSRQDEATTTETASNEQWILQQISDLPPTMRAIALAGAPSDMRECLSSLLPDEAPADVVSATPRACQALYAAIALCNADSVPVAVTQRRPGFLSRWRRNRNQ